MLGTIAQYSLLKEIGSGVFGTVFLAVGEVPGRGRNAISKRRIVAIKKLNDISDLESRHLLIQEFSLLDQVKHRCIVRVFEYLEKENAVVMEYIHGITLRQIIDALSNKRERMFTEAAIEIACEIADGLYQAYTIPGDNGEPLQLVHRDLKPANIIMTTTGDVKILDFGLARVGNSELAIDDSDKIRGTPIYMSPEQAKGEAVDHRTDLYALALILYEMLMGKPAYRIPLDAPNPVDALFEDVSAGRFDFDPHRLSKELPVIGDMITRCLKRNPKDRYPNGQEIVVDLRRQLMREQGEYLSEFADFFFETVVEMESKPSMAQIDKMLKDATSNSLSAQLRQARSSSDTPLRLKKNAESSKTSRSASSNKVKYIKKVNRTDRQQTDSGEPMAKGPKRPPVGGGASRNRPSATPGRVEGAKSPDATGMLNFVPIDAEEGGAEDENSATQFFAIPKPPQSTGGARNPLTSSNPNLNAPPPGGGFSTPPVGGFAPPPPPPPGGMGHAPAGHAHNIGPGGMGSGAGIGAGMGGHSNSTPFHQINHGPVGSGHPQSGQVGTQRVYVILGVVMFLILLIVAVTVYMAMSKEEKPAPPVENKPVVQALTEPADEEEFDEPADEVVEVKKKKKKRTKKERSESRPKKEKKKKESKTFKGGSMKVRVVGEDGPYSVNLSGCGSGRKRGKSMTFTNVNAGARCKVNITGVSATFTAKKSVTCRFTDGGSILKCR